MPLTTEDLFDLEVLRARFVTGTMLFRDRGEAQAALMAAVEDGLRMLHADGEPPVPLDDLQEITEALWRRIYSKQCPNFLDE